MSDLDDLEELAGPVGGAKRRRRFRGGQRVPGDHVTRCRRGHELTPENTYIQIWQGNTLRSCKRCRRLLAVAARERAPPR
jgi:hypothetical protein